MKLKFLILTAALCCMAQARAEYATAGDRSLITLSDLAATDGSGVTAGDNAFILIDDLTIAATDTLTLLDGERLLLADGVTITVNGVARFCPADTATITRLDDEATPRGIIVSGDDAGASFCHVDMSHINLRYSATSTPLLMDHCTMHHCNDVLNSNGGTVQLLTTVAGNRIAHCTFSDNASPAVGSAVNYPQALTMEHCTLRDNNNTNTNKPQLNLAVGGDEDVVISHCVIEGAGRTMVGGIGVSNFMGLDGAGRVIVDGCTITECRYGIACVGPVPQFIITGNTLTGNNHETNAMNGGSGISLYDPYAMTHARIGGNHIEGSLWGITVIGCADVNIGNVDVPADDADYNPGGNVFRDNGNGGVPYDLYNNSTLTIHAQGNTWSVPVQDAEHIEQVIFHKADNPALGEVIYLPAAEQAGIDRVSTTGKKLRYDTATSLVTAAGAAIAVHDMAGRTVAQGATVNVTALPAGVYVATAAGETLKFMKR